MKKFSNAGFTLIEMIVVISIMGVLGLIFTDILIQTLRGENKVKLISQVKQNGQVSLDKVTNMIRQAEKVVCVGDSGLHNANPADDTIVLYRGNSNTWAGVATESANVYFRFRFYQATSTQNGYIAGDTFDRGYYQSDIPIATYCTMNLQSQQFYLTDTDPLSGVSIAFDSTTSGTIPIFKLDRQPGYNDVVTVRFRAFQGVSAGSSYEKSLLPEGILFTTSVQSRGIR